MRLQLKKFPLWDFNVDHNDDGEFWVLNMVGKYDVILVLIMIMYGPSFIHSFIHSILGGASVESGPEIRVVENCVSKSGSLKIMMSIKKRSLKTGEKSCVRNRY